MCHHVNGNIVVLFECDIVKSMFVKFHGVGNTVIIDVLVLVVTPDIDRSAFLYFLFFWEGIQFPFTTFIRIRFRTLDDVEHTCLRDPICTSTHHRYES